MSTAALEAMFPINVPGWVVLDRAPDAEILREAVRGVMLEFPALASGLKPGWIRSRYEHIEALEPPLLVADLDCADPESIPAPLLDFFTSFLDMRQGPLAAFCLVRTADIAFVGANVHHGACDGRGLRYLLTALAAHYNALAAGKQLDRPVFRLDRIPNVIYAQVPARRRAALMMKALKMFRDCFRADRPDKMEAKEGPGDFTPVFFAGEERDRIIAKTKALGITVNDLFLAALVRVFHRWNGKIGALNFLIPQDLRPYGVSAPGVFIEEGEWRTVGNVVGAILLFLLDNLPLQEPDGLRRAISGLTRAEKKAGSAFAFTSLANLPINLFPAKPFMFIYRRLDPGAVIGGVLHLSTCFSNVGAAPERHLQFGDARPLHFAFALPFIPNGGAIFTAAGMGESISFVITHPRDMDAQKFVTIFKQEVFN
jgi:hypothetical protein